MTVIDEVARAKRVADMLASGHSKLRDKYARRAVMLDSFILAASAWMAALGFVDPSIGEKLGLSGVKFTLTIGVLGLLTFILSILQLRLDWKRLSGQHEAAAKQFSAIKLDLQRVGPDMGCSEEEMKDVLSHYCKLGEQAIEIPEALFPKLKQMHYRKIALSKEIDLYPNTSLFILRARLWIRDTLKIAIKQS